MNKQEANAAIAEKVREATKLLSEAEDIADKHGLDFRFSPAYGMGGTYIGVGHPELEDDDGWGPEQGWNPSSQSC